VAGLGGHLAGAATCRAGLAGDGPGSGTPVSTAGDFSTYEAFRLVPTEADLKAGQRLELTVETCVRVNVDHLAELTFGN
jgi:hypothetical protein